ncbi:MAG: imidazolonepropionase [Bacteroidia bacterium]|nr:imidazolonepropionase [Bacteroidia bacterium]NNK69838.1 imidazolonepropionase [Flavobacteriaceae bacterium]
MSVLFKNIKTLLQVRDEPPKFVSGHEMKELPLLENAYLLIENDTIVDYGLMSDSEGISAEEEIDASGRMILPCWCDSHTHIVYAGNREQEFVDRINGLSYEEIAERGGGILNSSKKLNETSEDELYFQSVERIHEIMQQGTGAVEIKSGYGLSPEGEIKMLKVIKRIRKEFQLKVVPTFLGAHAVPEKYKNDKSAYVDLIIDEMLPEIHENRLAKFIDVFCEKGYFDLEDTERLIKAGKEYHMRAKVHVNQFNAFGGVKLCTDHNALSVDHLEELTQEDIDALKGSKTMPVALPGCSFFLGIPYTPARKIIDAGLPLAVASDYNPGSAPSGNMNFVLNLACIKMKMTPEEAINAATLNAAYAMGVQSLYGSISRGKRANIFMTEPMSSYNVLPYNFGKHHIEAVMINGEFIKKPQD